MEGWNRSSSLQIMVIKAINLKRRGCCDLTGRLLQPLGRPYRAHCVIVSEKQHLRMGTVLSEIKVLLIIAFSRSSELVVLLFGD